MPVVGWGNSAAHGEPGECASAGEGEGVSCGWSFPLSSGIETSGLLTYSSWSQSQPLVPDTA